MLTVCTSAAPIVNGLNLGMDGCCRLVPRRRERESDLNSAHPIFYTEVIEGTDRWPSWAPIPSREIWSSIITVGEMDGLGSIVSLASSTTRYSLLSFVGSFLSMVCWSAPHYGGVYTASAAYLI